MHPMQASTKALLKFVGAYPPPWPKTTNVSDHDDVPFGVEVHHLAVIWHKIGNPHVPPMLSHDILASEKKYNNVTQIFRDFIPMTQAMRALFEVLDKDLYRIHQNLFKQSVRCGRVSMMETIMRNCFMGLAIIMRLYCGSHRNSSNYLDGWMMDFAFGKFEGGFFQISQIKLQFDLKLGSVLFMKSIAF